MLSLDDSMRSNRAGSDSTAAAEEVSAGSATEGEAACSVGARDKAAGAARGGSWPAGSVPAMAALARAEVVDTTRVGVVSCWCCCCDAARFAIGLGERAAEAARVVRRGGECGGSCRARCSDEGLWRVAIAPNAAATLLGIVSVDFVGWRSRLLLCARVDL